MRCLSLIADLRHTSHQTNTTQHPTMKILFYFLTAVLGLFGILAVVRTVERLVSGAGLLPAQLLIAIVALVLAGVCLKKARTSGTEKK